MSDSEDYDSGAQPPAAAAVEAFQVISLDAESDIAFSRKYAGSSVTGCKLPSGLQVCLMEVFVCVFFVFGFWSIARSPTHSPTHSLTHPLTHSLTQPTSRRFLLKVRGSSTWVAWWTVLTLPCNLPRPTPATSCLRG